MIKHTYHLRLASPAFLGDAEQKGVWRTPPLKALIREWWRIAVARAVDYDFRALKARETALFGTAADDNSAGSQRSKIRLALAHWNEGQLTDWSKVNPGTNGKPGEDPKVKHKEVDFAGGMVGSQLYLGYGPLVLEKGKPYTKLKYGAALQANDSNTLRLALPEADLPDLRRALALAHWLGTVGGRSRNGWGSLSWTAADSTPPLAPLTRINLERTGCTRALADCLKLEWPHAIGSDGKNPLVWCSQQHFDGWREAMVFLARTKIAFRTAFDFDTGKHASRVEPRHVLAYPVTNHSVAAWGNNSRLANTLRFKLHLEDDRRVRALIYHTPCKPTLPHAGIDLLDTWQRVHRFLDNQATLARLA
ncbi:MAG TPA: hypothetical protein PL143_04930 [Rhodocyclaceae bacterium]|nr:hypothetical protein [Rhodocyclaceae bacterium]